MTKRLNGVGLANRIQSPISETVELLFSGVDLRRERYRATPAARPREGARKSREFGEGNWERRLWKRFGKGFNWLLLTTRNVDW